MTQVIVLSFLAGLMGTNGIPHFVQGITAREYPNMTGNSALRNVIGGWVAFLIAGLLVAAAHVDHHPRAAVIAAALGALVMAVFHAQRGAYWMNTRFGRPNPAHL
jgi:Na+/proline symporter